MGASRIDAILEVPWEVLEYERWVTAQAAPDEDYLFAENRVRFAVRDDDVLRTPGDLAVRDGKAGVELVSNRLGGSIAVVGVKRAAAERLLAAMDGKLTLAELRSRAGNDAPALDRLLTGGIGTVLFLPEAVAALEASVSGVELVRFVSTPYEIVREYWANMADVRAVSGAELDQVSTEAELVRALRRLHVVTLLGADLQSFYRPASRITRNGVRPGALYTAPTRLVRRDAGVLMLEGPRIGLALVGGDRYQALVGAAAGDSDAISPARVECDADGVLWGERLLGRAPGEREDRAWFCPPRPLHAAHFEKLTAACVAAKRAAEAGDATRCTRELAHFHQRFVRMHPFRCANQSLVMSLVNGVLSRCIGAGIPHLLLDQLALRLTEAAYERVFALAVDQYVVTGSAAVRWAELRTRKASSYAFIQRLQRAASDNEARLVLSEMPESARLALVAV